MRRFGFSNGSFRSYWPTIWLTLGLLSLAGSACQKVRSPLSPLLGNLQARIIIPEWSRREVLGGTLIIEGAKPVEFEVTGRESEVEIKGIPPGSKKVRVDLRNSSNTILYQGSAQVRILPAQTSQVLIIVEPVNEELIARFVVLPAWGDMETLFTFDASECTDSHEPSSILEMRWDWEDDDTWDTDYSTQKKAVHKYASKGTKTVRLRVRNSQAMWGETTGKVEVRNRPPAAPTIPVGQDRGFRGVSYTFTVSGIDPDGDQLQYRFSWGDGSISDWGQPVLGGSVAIMNHSWPITGSYSIRAQAKDTDIDLSKWSAPSPIEIVKQPLAVPSNPLPQDGATDVATTLQLTWSGLEEDIGVEDVVVYDIFLEAEDNSPDLLLASNVIHTWYPVLLGCSSSYYWQVIARRGSTDRVSGPVWSFRTSEMLYVPAGEFIMGSESGEAWRDEGPVHKVYLDAFLIDTFEVTWAQYVQFLNAGGNDDHWHPYQKIGRSGSPGTYRYWARPGYENYPAVHVTWFDAHDYTFWIGKRLPTEAEWEKAARGIEARTYPWGNEVSRDKANWKGDADGWTGPAPVGSFPAGVSPYGAEDMAGNVWEWVEDWYYLWYYQVTPYYNPPGPATGTLRGVRGGSWDYTARYMRSANRNCCHGEHGGARPDGRWGDIGFRCAKDAE